VQKQLFLPKQYSLQDEAAVMLCVYRNNSLSLVKYILKFSRSAPFCTAHEPILDRSKSLDEKQIVFRFFAFVLQHRRPQSDLLTVNVFLRSIYAGRYVKINRSCKLQVSLKHV